MNSKQEWRIENPGGTHRVIVTKALPGDDWLKILTDAGCRVEICLSKEILKVPEIIRAMGTTCHGAIGQLTEDWGEALFSALKKAGGKAYSNYAVGYNNIDLASATACGIPVGNTPGVLTEATAEMALTLTMAAARRVGAAERFLRAGKFSGWLPGLFLGELLHRKTVGVIGAGRIGSAYAKMMVQAHKMNLLYYDLAPNPGLEAFMADFSRFLEDHGEDGVTWEHTPTVEDLLKRSDVVSIHTLLNDSTFHLINEQRLGLMKKTAVLINTSRGPVVDEAALAAHLKAHPGFAAGLDVFENEPALAQGLAELDNAVMVPHIASATRYSREGMAVLAARNVAGILNGWPPWNQPDIRAFLTEPAPEFAPSIVNAKDLGLV